MKTVLVSRTEPVTQVTNFDAFDTKGRNIGIRVTVYEAEFEEKEVVTGTFYRLSPGKKFVAYCMTTRDGVTFGATQSPNFFDTREQRDTYVAKRIGAGLKAALKKAAI